MAGPSGEVQLPSNLVEAAHKHGREKWLAGLPGRISRLEHRFGITAGEPFQPGGQTAWVAPAVDGSGASRVLKILWRHYEAAHEADALREWAGGGAVELFGVEESEDTIALLLERCEPGTTLKSEPEATQDVVISGLLRRLWIQPSVENRFRPLAEMCDRWAAATEEKMAVRGATVDAGIAREGLELFRELPRSATTSVLLATDLHAENVLAARREPWLAIDPKPYVGDPAYDVIQHMLNCEERLATAPRDLAWRMADLAGLDRGRVVSWLFARCVQESPDWPMSAEIAHALSPG